MKRLELSMTLSDIANIFDVAPDILVAYIQAAPFAQDTNWVNVKKHEKSASSRAAASQGDIETASWGFLHGTLGI